MLSIHWPRIHHEKAEAEKAGRSLNTVEEQAWHLREAYVGIALLFTLVLLVVWGATGL